MEFCDELLLSLITILFALLIGKIASAAAAARSKSADRSVELEEIGRKISRSQEVEPVLNRSQSEQIGSIGVENRDEILLERSNEARADEFDIEMEVNGDESRSEADDVAIEKESAKDFDEEDEEERSGVVNVAVEEESVEIGNLDAESVKKVERCPGTRSVDEEGCEKSCIDEEKGSWLCGEDEWEGIEKSELEKFFGVATEFVGSENGSNALSKLSSDVQKQLYGFHKVATEGPCYEPQPLALKVSTRAKWQSWQRLGNMNPEMAMEQYITLLSESIPGWMGAKPGVDAKQGKGDDTLDVGSTRTEKPDLSSFLHGQPSSGTQRIFEDPSCVEVDKPTSGLKLFEQGLTKTFLFDLLSPTRVRFLTFYW